MNPIDFKDFSSLFELAAGLNAAYVLVKSTDLFTVNLFQVGFDFQEQLNKSKRSFLQKLPDKDSLDTLQQSAVSRLHGDTVKNIERISTGVQSIKNSVESSFNSQIEISKKECTIKSHSILSLFSALFCIGCLFALPFDLDPLYILVFGILSFLYLVFGWVNSNECKIYDSYGCSIFIFLYICILVGLFFVINSLFLSINTGFSSFWRSIIYIMVALLPFVNFAVYFLKVKLLLSKANKELKKLIDEKEKEATPLIADYEAISRCAQMNEKIEISVKSIVQS